MTMVVWDGHQLVADTRVLYTGRQGHGEYQYTRKLYNPHRPLSYDDGEDALSFGFSGDGQCINDFVNAMVTIVERYPTEPFGQLLDQLIDYQIGQPPMSLLLLTTHRCLVHRFDGSDHPRREVVHPDSTQHKGSRPLAIGSGYRVNPGIFDLVPGITGREAIFLASRCDTNVGGQTTTFNPRTRQYREQGPFTQKEKDRLSKKLQKSVQTHTLPE